MQRGRGYYPRNINERGRRPHYNVEDLREKLNRMKLEKEKGLNSEGIKNPPPPDPAYNFLKDPLRGDNCANTSNEKKIGNKDQNKSESKETDDQKNSAETNEKNSQKQRNVRFAENLTTPSPQRGPPRPHWSTPRYGQRHTNNLKENQVETPKQRSVNNIKVEVSSESGERQCTFDDSKTVEVPVMPKRNYTVRPKSGRWSCRGPQRYYSGRYNKPKPTFQSTLDGNIQNSYKRGNRHNFKNKRANKNENQIGDKDAKNDNVTDTDNKKQVNKNETEKKKGESETKTDVQKTSETEK